MKIKFSVTKFILVNFVFTIMVGGFVNNLVAQSCIVPILPSWLPCWVWNMLGISIVVALLMDIAIYYFPRIFRLKRNDVLIKIGEYRNRGYFQSDEIGIQITNDSDYKIFASAKLIGEMRQVDYFDDGSEKSSPFPIDKKSCIIRFDPLQIKSEDTKEMIFVKVENNENVSLLTSPPQLLKSFYSVRTGDYEVKTTRWYFNFEPFGEMKGMKFKEGIYSTFIQASIRNDEVYLVLGDIKKIK